VPISNTGGWQTWGSVTTNLTSSVTGVHTVVITFTGSGGEFVNLNWFRFGH
jgi:beta-galactosidase